MLVLTRRPGEAIVIADNIQVTVLTISGSRVRLGISAPPDIPVDRSEIRELRGRKQSDGRVVLQN